MLLKQKLTPLFQPVSFLEGYHSPYRLDVSNRRGGLLVYVNASTSTRQLKYEIKYKYIQIISSEINLGKEKWFVVSISRPTSQNSEYFLNAFTDITDYFSRVYENHLIMGAFNLEPNDPCMKSFLNSNSFTNLIKTNTCFKGAGSCIDLVLTNKNILSVHKII